MEKMNIYQRLAAITAELGVVAKNLTVETAKGKGYKAVSERDVLDTVKPLEAKYGVFSYPSNRRVIESNLLESESTYNGNTTKKTTIMTRIEVEYRFVNVDDPGEFVQTVVFAEGLDTQDKGAGKAMTYADKYALMKMYKISTGDDPDQNASEEHRYVPAASAQYHAPSAPVATGRNELILALKEKGINFSEFAAQHGLDKNTSDMVFHKLANDLRTGAI